MEAGQSGTNGEAALYLVEKETKFELELVTILLLCMEEKTVPLMDQRIQQTEDVIKIPVQVCLSQYVIRYDFL